MSPQNIKRRRAESAAICLANAAKGDKSHSHGATAAPSLRRNLSRPGNRNPRPNMWGARDTSSLSSSSGDENTRSGSASKDNGGVI